MKFATSQGRNILILAPTRKRQFFQFYTLPFKRWVSFKRTDFLPECPCCYAIYISGKLVYVGSTTNLKARIRAHNCSSFWFYSAHSSRIKIKARMPEKYGDWLMSEARLIRRLKPINSKR